MTDHPKNEPSSALGGIASRLRRGGIWVFLGRSMGMGTVFAITVLLAKNLNDASFANYVVTASLVTLTGMMAMFGLNYLMCRMIAAAFASDGEVDPKQIALRIGVTSFVTISAIGGVFFFISKFIFNLMGAEALIPHVPAITCWIVLLSLSQIVAETFRGLHHLFAASLLAGVSGGLLANFIFLSTIVYLIWNEQLQLDSIMIAGPSSFVAPILLSSIWLIFAWPKAKLQKWTEKLERKNSKPDKPGGGQLHPQSFRGLAVLKEAFPIMLLNLSAYGIDQSGQLLAKSFGEDIHVNSFEAVWKLGFLIVVPLTMLGLASASTISEQYSKNNLQVLQNVLRSVSTISLLLSLPLFLLLVFAGGPILGIVFQPSFAIGAGSLAILASVQMVRNWMGPCDVILVMTGHQWWALACFLVALPVLAIGPFAINQFGVLGITAVVAAALLISRIGQYLVVRRKIGILPQANLAPVFITRLFRFTTNFRTPPLSNNETG